MWDTYSTSNDWNINSITCIRAGCLDMMCKSLKLSIDVWYHRSVLIGRLNATYWWLMWYAISQNLVIKVRLQGPSLRHGRKREALPRSKVWENFRIYFFISHFITVSFALHCKAYLCDTFCTFFKHVEKFQLVICKLVFVDTRGKVCPKFLFISFV